MGYGGIAFVQSNERCYGVRGRLLLPCLHTVSGADRRNYFNAYFALINPTAENDPRVEAGLMRYPSKKNWTLFLWSPTPGATGPQDKKGEWLERPIMRSSSRFVELKLMFAPDDRGKVDLYVDGQRVFRSALGGPLSQASYEAGGLAAKACIGLDNQDKTETVMFDSLTWSALEIAKDKNGSKWSPMPIGKQGVKGQPKPRVLSFRPSLSAGFP